MTTKTHPVRRIMARFFPKKYMAPQKDFEEWDVLSDNQKKDLACHYLSQGELSLLQGNLSALSLFESASRLDPENPEIWYRQGLSFFEYGSEEGKEKALLLASKYFKIASQLAPHLFKIWHSWGCTLLQLGKFHEEHHFLLEAKEKLQKAIDFSSNISSDEMGDLYWDLGILWKELAIYSGEALDLRLAIDAFETAKKCIGTPSPEFYNDFGNTFLELGLLVNDPRLFTQSIDLLQKAVKDSPIYFDGWVSLGEGYSQAYVNTMDERLITEASNAFSKATVLDPKNTDVWLSWAQILGESGRLNQDVKMLRLSIEKCARGSVLSASEDPEIVAQWAESLSFLGQKTSRLDLIQEAEHKLLKALGVFPDDPSLFLAYGITCMAFAKYYEDGDYYELAIEKLQYGLSMDRTSAEHWHALGMVHKAYAALVEHEDLLERASRFFARAIDLKPSCPAYLFDAASTLLRYSELSDHLPSLEMAIKHFEHLLQHYKEAILHHPEWLYEYATALEWLGGYTGDESHYTRAIELFTYVLLIDPDYPAIHKRLAHCYVELGHLSDEPEFYRRASHFFRLTIKHDEENDQAWLDWGVSLIHLAEHTLDTELMKHLYWDAEQKINRAGALGNPNAYYNLACLHSLLGRTDVAMEFIHKALNAKVLPTIEEMCEDEWLENLCSTDSFAKFVNAIESKLHSREE